ncbi:MAG: MaoC family dehydratase [Betaproteobacteria bacterium]
MSTAGGMDGSGKHYDEVAEGDSWKRSLTVTDAHLVIGAGLIGDFNPHHVDDDYARGSRFGTRILHGMLTSAMMGGALGMIFHGTAIALLDHATRFVAPVRPGDTVTTTWTVAGRTDKARHGGGIVALTVIAVNQRGETVADGKGTMLVHATAAWLARQPASDPPR